MTEIHTRLRGMAWSHRRGIEPLRACARLLKAQGISIEWDARSLQGFEEATILDLGKTYDLIAIDHPFMGQAFRDRALLPVDEIVGADFVDELKAQSVGPSLESYIWRNRLWAIPVDAAAQVAAFRADLLARAGVTVPTSWREVLALAGAAPVALAANPTHLLLAFATICHAVARDRSPLADLRPAWWADDGFDRQAGLDALAILRAMMKVAHPASWDYDPIMLFDHMAAHDDIAYTPVAFGYSNYARPDEYARPLGFVGVPSRDGETTGGMLGGVGLCVSRHCKSLDEVGRALRFIAGRDAQCGIYTEAGGQPAYRAAWTSPEIEALCPNFFRPTLASLDLSFVRPRLPDYPRFQRDGGEMLHRLLRRGDPDEAILAELNHCWRELCLTTVPQ